MLTCVCSQALQEEDWLAVVTLLPHHCCHVALLRCSLLRYSAALNFLHRFMVIVLWNLPPWMRTKEDFLLPWGILPQGVKSSDFPLYYQPFQGIIYICYFILILLTDFCAKLATKGITVYNGFTKTVQRKKGFNVFTVADYPACCECSNTSNNGKKGCAIAADYCLFLLIALLF